MIADWQTWAALAVVTITASVMVWRMFGSRKGGCATGCGCAGVKPKVLKRKEGEEQEPI